MPGFDGTGPGGQGPLTGGGFGNCGYGVEKSVPRSGGRLGRGRGGSPRGGGRGFGYGGGRSYSRGRGFARGRGRGFGGRNRYSAVWTDYGPPVSYGEPLPVDEIGLLKNRADLLKQELDDISARIEDLTSSEG